MIRISFISLALLTFLCSATFAQSDSIRYEVEAQATTTTEGTVPFWMRSNQYGSVPLSGVSASVIARAHKNYSHESADNWYGKKKAVDWGAGFEGRGNIGDGSNMILVEAYAKMRWTIFEIKAGRSKDVMGLNGDTSLSTGNFAVSGNALGVPKVEISIPDYWTLPFSDGLFAIKGNFAHGWLGQLPIAGVEDRVGTYFHQKSLYGTIGRDSWAIKLLGGFNHQVFWGNERDIFEADFDLSTFNTFLYVITGKAYGKSNTKVLKSKVGNHIGSIDLGLKYDMPSWDLMVYRQNFYDVGALSKLANIKDGLTGISVSNKLEGGRSQSFFKWKKLLLEFFYSKNQAGVFGSKYTRSGDENYYNNYIYSEGWSYNQLALGNPLITAKEFSVEGAPSDPKDYFLNNRVVAGHLGFEGGLGNIDLLLKLTYSSNFGTFSTSPEGRTTGNIRLPPAYGLFGKKNQFSGFVALSKELQDGYRGGISISHDQGDLLNNASGVQIQIVKTF